MKRQYGLVIGILLLCITPLAAQDARGGAIYVINPGSAEQLTPLLCNDPICQQLGEIAFPWLLGVDPSNGLIAAAEVDERALVTEWATTDGLRYTLTLRADLTWNDGAPVTAFDVFYTYLALTRLRLNNPYAALLAETDLALLPLDAHRLLAVVAAPECRALDALRFPVLPAHAFAADFAPTFAPEADAATLHDWRRDDAPDFSQFVAHPYHATLPITRSGTAVTEVRGGDTFRVRLGEAVGLFVYQGIDTASGVDYLINGVLDVVERPARARWRDLEQAGAQLLRYPAYTVEYIGLNLADPQEPRSAFDADDNPQEQGRHPILGDGRVRRALRLGLDVTTLIAASSDGYGTPLAGYMPPGVWAADPNAALPVYDPAEARALLDAAGWRLGVAQGETTRRCLGCADAPTGTELALRLVYTDTPAHRAMLPLLTQQMRALGMRLDASSLGAGDPTSALSAQNYDLVLAQLDYAYPFRPDSHDALFLTAADVVGSGRNAGSYHNAEVDALLTAAAVYPNCAPAARAAQYAEVQRLLAEDLPFLWLYTPDEALAVQSWVSGVTAYPYQPFWNLGEWKVFYGSGN